MFDEETPINDTNLPLSIPEAVWDHQHKIHHPSGVCTSRTRAFKYICWINLAVTFEIKLWNDAINVIIT